MLCQLFSKMDLVHCPCKFCHGKKVTLHTRREHAKRFSSHSDSGRKKVKINDDDAINLSCGLVVETDAQQSLNDSGEVEYEADPSDNISFATQLIPNDNLLDGTGNENDSQPAQNYSGVVAMTSSFDHANGAGPGHDNNLVTQSDGDEHTTPHISDDADPLCQHFDPIQYKHGAAITPLYEGASITILEAVAQHLLWFTDHPGTSKQALTAILEKQHDFILPKDNLLPSSYQSALKVVDDFIIKPLVLDACPNDCILFRGSNASLVECPECGAERYKRDGKCAVRRFHYLPIGPRLERLFGTANLAKVVQAHSMSPPSSPMFDLHDSPAWRSAYSDTGIFKGDSRGVSLGLCTDGVNPFSHLRCTYSMWPIVLSLLNLPRKIRHNFENMLLVGIIPGNGRKEAHSIHPYLEVLVDEIIHLSNAKLHDAYQEASFDLKVEILLYILDYPGVGKVFNMHGAGSYKGCLWCDIKGTYSKTLSKMVYLESRRYLPQSSPLRKDRKGFPVKKKELSLPPKCRQYSELQNNHQAYDNAKNKSQAAAIAKSTGCKGSYPLLKLKFHDPIQHTVPDSMHTIKDAIEHFFYLIVGRDDCSKTVQCELELKRFVYKKDGKLISGTPYRITKEEKKVADTRACTIICPQLHIWSIFLKDSFQVS